MVEHPPATADPRLAPARWVAAALLGSVLLSLLGAILGRVVWLYESFGLFFFLLAALLVGSVLFQILRRARPVRGAPLTLLAMLVAGVGWSAALWWEWRDIVDRVSSPPRFAAARQKYVNRGEPHERIDGLSRDAFERRIAAEYPPGGVIGYARWAGHVGEMELSIGDAGLGAGEFKDSVRLFHRGWAWIVRCVAAYLLLALGLWWPLTSLRQREPVSNLIDPEEAEQLDQIERRKYGEPCYEVFERATGAGVEARAPKWPDLLEQAARGMLSCIGHLVPKAGGSGDVVRIVLKAPTREELLHNWLAELLNRFETRGEMPTRIRFESADETRLAARVTFKTIDTDRSRLRRSVRALADHGLEVRRDGKQWAAQVILDIRM